MLPRGSGCGRGWTRLLAPACMLSLIATAGARRVEPRVQDGGAAIATSRLELPSGGEVELRHHAVEYPADVLARMRADPATRQTMNERWPLLLGATLTTTVALRLEDVRIEPGTHRVSLAMSDTGAWGLAVLEDQRFRRVGFDLSTASHRFPWLHLAVMPSTEGLAELLLRWGDEHGRLVLRRAGE